MQNKAPERRRPRALRVLYLTLIPTNVLSRLSIFPAPLLYIVGTLPRVYFLAHILISRGSDNLASS